MYKVQNYNSAFFTLTLLTQLYVRVSILLMCRKQVWMAASLH